MSRFQILRAVFWRPWIVVVGALYGVVSAADFVAEKTLPAPYLNVWEAWWVLPTLTWRTWVMIGLLLSIWITLEGTVRLVRSLELDSHTRLAAQQDANQELTARLDERRRVADFRQFLAQMIDAAVMYERSWRNHAQLDLLPAEISDWHAEVLKGLGQHGDQSYLHLYWAANSEDDPQPGRTLTFGSDTGDLADQVPLLYARRRRLEQFLNALPR